MINAETWFTGTEAAEYFNVKVTDSVEALNCTGTVLQHWSKLPATFKPKNSPDEEVENTIKMQQEIEIALAL